jgi:hypothetical protein
MQYVKDTRVRCPDHHNDDDSVGWYCTQAHWRISLQYTHAGSGRQDTCRFGLAAIFGMSEERQPFHGECFEIELDICQTPEVFYDHANVHISPDGDA